jgi:succinate-semialdehyde dehydrogenase/glutarate-semialdehyde dehydrogenase
VRALADVLEKDQEAFARTITLEMGKPIAQARSEVAKSAGVLRYYAEHAAAMLADEPVTTTSASHGVRLRYEPIGPVLP